MTDFSASMYSCGAWLVDLDGTLYDPMPVKLAMAAEVAIAGWKDISVIRRFRREHERIRYRALAARGLEESDASASPFDEQIWQTAMATGQRPDDVRRVVSQWMIERPSRWLRLFRRRSLIRQIARFRAAGGRTAIVSDYPAVSKLTSMGVLGLFDEIIANGEAGGPTLLKPHPQGIWAALERLEVAPANAVMIGDRVETDGRAAHAAGVSFHRIGSNQIVRSPALEPR